MLTRGLGGLIARPEEFFRTPYYHRRLLELSLPRIAGGRTHRIAAPTLIVAGDDDPRLDEPENAIPPILSFLDADL